MRYSWSDDDGLTDRIREMCDKEATDEELLEVIGQYFRDASDDSALTKVLLDLADIELQGALDAHERNIRCEIETAVEAKYDVALDEVKREYESRATYDLIEDRFLSEPQFRERVLSRIRRDLSESKELGDVSPLFDRALDGCNQDTLISLLLEEHRPELLEKFHSVLVERYLLEHEAELRDEIKTDLMRNETYMHSLKVELLDHVARRLFDEV